MKVNIYIESSVKSIRKQSGVVGFILEDDRTKETITQFGKLTEETENGAQVLALKYALARIKPGSEIEIFTESQYLESAFGWMDGWIERDWKTVKGKEVAHKEAWQEILEKLNGTVPSFQIGVSHEYRNWLTREVERRAKKYV